MQFQADLTSHERAALIVQMEGELLAWLPALHTAQIRIRSDRSLSQAQTYRQQLLATEDIVFIEPDGLVEAAMIPNDPDITDQRKVYAPELINLLAGWEYTTGAPEIVVAILDSGISQTHVEFTGQIQPGYDFVQQDNTPQDENGHGTHVAGIVGARLNNKAGVAGVCANCQLLPVRVLNAHNIGSWMNVAQGVTYAVDHGARVIVMSLGSSIYSQTMKNAVDYAQQHGVLLVAAAGNSNSAEPFYPAAFSEVLGVGATTRQEQRWSFSNYGQNADVVAPGDAIYSTYPDFYRKSDGYQALTGTSMAAPFVAGLAGLLLAQDPTRTISDVTSLITTTAVDLGDPGVDARFGAGRIDVAAALAAAAATKLASGRVSGTASIDQDVNGQFDPTVDQAMTGLVIQVQNEQAEQVGLAVTDSAGGWQMSGLPTGAYTLHVTGTIAADLTPAPDLRVVLTEPVTVQGLNFSFVTAPTSQAIAGFSLVRATQNVTLTWTVTHPLVNTILVQRSLAAQSEYTTVLTRTVTAEEVAAQQPIHLFDYLPAELSQTPVYYQLLLAPSNARFGPREALPQQRTYAHALFIPYIVSLPELGQ